MYSLPYNKQVISHLSNTHATGNRVLRPDQITIFVSSKISGMELIRENLCSVFQDLGFRVLAWERASSIGMPQKHMPRDVYRDAIRDCAVYVGVIDSEYGAELPNGISATEDEYNYAKELCKELALFISNQGPKEPKAKSLSDKWKKEHTISTFENIIDLQSKGKKFAESILIRLGRNWIMIGDIITYAPYSESREGIQIQFETSDWNILKYFKAIGKDQLLPFIDLQAGSDTAAHVRQCTIDRMNALTSLVTVSLEPDRTYEVLTWAEWSVLKDIDMRTLKMIQGEERIPQVLLMLLNTNKGEWVFDMESGSNIYSILDKYRDHKSLAELCIRFDVIEALTFPRIETRSGRLVPKFPCVEAVRDIQIGTQQKHSCDLSFLLHFKGRQDPYPANLSVSWESKN